VINPYSGPYLSHEPEIQVFDVTRDDQYLIVASDGLWDEVKRSQVGAVIKDKDRNMESVASALFDAALNRICKESGISREFLSQLPPSKRKRSLHDDITILVLSLKNQAS